jgi:WD40 repeat protein
VKKILLWILLCVVGVWTCPSNAQFAEPLVVYAIDWSPDGTKIALVGDGVWVYEADLSSGTELQTDARGGIAWSPDGTKIAFGNEIWDAQTLQVLSTIEETEISLGSLPKSWSSDSKRVAALTSNQRDVLIFDASNGKLVQTIKGDSIYIDRLDWSPDDSQFVVSRGDKTIALMSVNTGSITQIYQAEMGLEAVAWHPDGKRIALSGSRSVERGTAGSVETAGAAVIFSVQIRDMTSGEVLQTFDGLHDFPSTLQWRSDGEELIGGAAGGSVFVWDTQNGLSAVLLSSGVLYDVDYSPLGGRIAIASNPSRLRYANPAARITTVKGQRIIQSLSNGILEIAVPSPSLETLQGLENQCLPAESERVVPDDERTLPQFRTQLNDLSSEFTHPTCAEELSAVAEAVIAEG